MNSKQAKQIPLEEILRRLGHLPERRMKGGAELFYLSPLRENDTTPSFKVDTRINAFFDHGLGFGGNSLDFVLAYMGSKGQISSPGISDALQFLDDLMGRVGVVKPFIKRPATEKKNELIIEIESVKVLHHPALLNYLKTRGIEDIGMAREFVKQVHFSYNDRPQPQGYFAIGLENKSGGYALRSPKWKQASSPNDFSIISGEPHHQMPVSVFEGMMDFLSYMILSARKKPEGNIIVLNSLSFVSPVIDYIREKNYQTVNTWLDNDSGGKKATDVLKQALEPQNIRFTAMNDRYKDHHDVNDYLLSLRQQDLFPGKSSPSGSDGYSR